MMTIVTSLKGKKNRKPAVKNFKGTDAALHLLIYDSPWIKNKKMSFPRIKSKPLTFGCESPGFHFHFYCHPRGEVIPTKKMTE